MDIRKVKKLIELLDESGIAEIEITEGEESVRISRYGQNYAPMPPPMFTGQPQQQSAPAQSGAPAFAGAAAGAEPSLESQPEDDGFAVTAPMVGTFYSAASPGSAPFVQVGDKISQGDTLCIVEAMKMMNQIESEVSGIVKTIRAQNGDPVEYGQVLFIIDQRNDA